MEKKNTRTYYFNGKPKLISWRVILLTVLVLAFCAGGFVYGIRMEADMINSSAAEASSRLLQKSRESASEVDLSTSLRKSTVNKVYDEFTALAGITGMTVSQVTGYGLQKGAGEMYRGVEVDARLLPKVKVEIVVGNIPYQRIVDVIKQVLYTGHIGDGKIFVNSVEKVVKVRTGEEDLLALTDEAE